MTERGRILGAADGRRGPGRAALRLLLFLGLLGATRAAPARAATAATPTAEETYMLELVNRARADPEAEYARLSIVDDPPMPTGARQPLALNTKLIYAARAHSKDMHDRDYFDHYTPPPDNLAPWDRMTAAGYIWIIAGENIAAGYATALAAHNALFIDTGIEDRGHRVNMLNASYREVGVGIYHGTLNYRHYYTQDFGARNGTPILCGVVFNDANGNEFYEAGEGRGGVTLTFDPGGLNLAVTAWGSGAYALELTGVPPGTYSVRASGGTLGGTITKPVTVGTGNVKCDFQTDEVVNLAPVIDAGPTADPNPLTLPATAALAVTAHDPEGDPLTYTWSKVSGPGTVGFSPNGTAGATTTTATFSAAGTYVVRVTVADNSPLSPHATGQTTIVVDGDSDDDGLTDGAEVNTHGTDPLAADSDGDGLDDGAEVNTYGTDPLAADSDADGLDDGEELSLGTDPLDPDSDGDGMPDGWEHDHNLNPLVSNGANDPDGDGLSNLVEYGAGTDPRDADSDADGLEDGVELLGLGTDPADADSDDDGLDDGAEVNTWGTDPLDPDSEDDGMRDGWEAGHGLDPLADDAAGDPDEDGLTNLDEFGRDTDPQDADTDNDGWSDGEEVEAGTNPLSAASHPAAPGGGGCALAPAGAVGGGPAAIFAALLPYLALLALLGRRRINDRERL